MCESLNTMVGHLRERSPNLSINVATMLVQFRKNLRFLGVRYIYELYDLIAEAEDEEVLDNFDEYIHGQGEFGMSQNQVHCVLVNERVEVAKQRAKRKQLALEKHLRPSVGIPLPNDRDSQLAASRVF